MANKPPAVSITGIRASIPSGYILGRASPGQGDVELISASKAQSVGLIPSTLPGPPTGSAGGDLSGSYPNPTVAQLQGRPVAATAPSNLAVLLYHTSGATWLPVVLATVAYTGAYSDLSGVPAIHNVPAGGTTGQVLTKNSNTDYDIVWATPSGGSGGGAASAQDDGTNLYLAISDGDGQLVLDGSGNPIFAKEVFPETALPPGFRGPRGYDGIDGEDGLTIPGPAGAAGAAGANGAAGAAGAAGANGSMGAPGYDGLDGGDVFFAVNGLFPDKVSLAVVAGLLATKFLGFLYTKTSDTAVSDAIITKMVMNSSVIDTTGGAYDTATGKFTATKPGKYICFAAAIGQVATAMSQTAIWIAKNGTVGGGGVTVIAVAGMGQASFNTARAVTAFVLGIADLNGTTDFIEFDAFVTGTGGSNVIVNPNSTFFGAFYAGS